MIQRILSSKNFVACLLAAVMGMALYFKLPFPAENAFLRLMALQAPFVHEGLFYSYNHFLFTTPYIAYLIVLSGLYVFGLTLHKKIRVGELPRYPEAAQIYHVDDFKLRTDAHDDHRDRQDPHEGGRSNPHGDLSQSERDWAFAKLALARGDDPEEVIRRIADYRGDEKHDPIYYARLTVMKTQAQLEKGSDGAQPETA